MKLVTLFAVGATAVLVRRAEVEVMEAAIADIQQEIETFHEHVNDYSSSSLVTLRKDIHDVTSAIYVATGEAKGMKGPLGVADAAKLAGPIQKLRKSIGDAMDALVSRKSAMVKDCHGPELYQALVNQQAQANDFKKQLLPRIPAEAKNVASQVSSQIFDDFGKGVKAYENQEFTKCPGPDGPKGNGDQPTKGNGDQPKGNGDQPKGNQDHPKGGKPTNNNSGGNPPATGDKHQPAGNQGGEPGPIGGTPNKGSTDTGSSAPSNSDSTTHPPTADNSNSSPDVDSHPATQPTTPSGVPVVPNNGTSPTYTGPAPTHTIATGAASSLAMNGGLAVLGFLAYLAL